MTIPASALPAAPASPASLLAGSTPRWLRLALFAVWLVVVGYLAAHHVFWRDEVRAFTLALTGDSVIAMARAVHGEGHPLLWYLLLRAAHALVPVREVLPAVGLIVGVAGAALFAWRAPFKPVVIVAVLFGAWTLFEYTVMARNYGISMLLLFVLADRFARGKDGGVATGALLFLLCNTNVPSVLLAGAFLLFWLIEIVSATGLRRSPALWRFVTASSIALAGVVACFLAVYPPFNDAAVSPLAAHLTPLLFVEAAINVAGPMSYLMPELAWQLPAGTAILALLVVASPFSLLRSPGGLVAGVVTLPAMLLFFQLVYPGSYRHQALFLCFLVTLHWMVACGRGGAWRNGSTLAEGLLPRIGTVLLAVLLLIQLAPVAPLVAGTARGAVSSQSAALGRLLSRPELARAIVLGDPDVLVEALPYYAPNPTYLLREHRFGNVSRFTRHAQLDLSLGDVLATARRLHARTGRPIVILMKPEIDPAAPAATWQEGYLGSFAMTPDQARDFRAATRRIAGPVPILRYTTSDEAYDVYLLRPAKMKAGVTAS